MTATNLTAAALAANNLTSILLIIVLAALVAQNAGGREPLRMAIALGYAGWCLLACAYLLWRNEWADLIPLEWKQVAGKSIIIYTLGLVAIRLEIMRRDRNSD